MELRVKLQQVTYWNVKDLYLCNAFEMADSLTYSITFAKYTYERYFIQKLV